MADFDVIVRTELARSDRPLTAAETTQLLDGKPPAEVATALDQLVERGEAHRWGKGRYWSTPPARGLAAVVRRLVDEEPRTRAQIEAGLPAAFRVDPDALKHALSAMVEQGALFVSDPARWAKGSDRGLRFSLEDPQVALRRAIPPLLGDRPTTVAQLAKRLPGRPTQKAVTDALVALAKEGGAHRWRRGSYARRSVTAALRAEVEGALRAEPLPKTKLKAALPSARMADEPSFSAALVELGRERRVYRIKKSSSVVYGTRAQAIARALGDLERNYGLSKEDLREALAEAPTARSEPALRPEAFARPEADLLDDIRRAREARRSSVLPVRDLRSVSRLDPPTFDRDLLGLMRRGVVDLYEHDGPSRLPPDEVVVDERGRTYNAVVLKEVR